MTEAEQAATKCDHGIVFDLAECRKLGLSSDEVRKKYPRHNGLCPKGCGFYGIAYQGYQHFTAGAW